METLLIASALIFVLIFEHIPLAILAVGIHRQERTGSLTSCPRSLSAALTSRVLDLQTARTPAPSPSRQAHRAPALTPASKETQPS